MFRSLWSPFQKKLIVLFHTLQRQIKTWAKPLPLPVTAGVLTDLPRTKTDLILENALLRHRLVVLQRHVKRPHFTWKDRIFMVVTASRLPAWRQALLIVQPDTVLRWHRDLFKHIWRRKSRQRGGHPPLNPEIVALIQQMATANRLWGAERIRGELRKLGWRVGKGTVLNYLRRFRPVRPPSQTWKTFLRNHADAIWACDFIQVTDVCFRSLFIFVIVELSSRRVVQLGVTRHPTDAWVAQQLREATPFQQGPKYLIRDNDRKYGERFAAVAEGTSIDVVRTPIRAPRANAVCERFIGSVRRECLDHLLILDEHQLFRMMKAYIEYYNQYRPHQGLNQRIPASVTSAQSTGSGPITAQPILGGLHHPYSRAV